MKLLLSICAFFIVVFCEAQLQRYNIIWNTQSENAGESMPVGGGDIGTNVWVENNELLSYICRSGSYDETNTLLKAGRVRFSCSPNIFNNASFFEQKLELEKGYITVKVKNGKHVLNIKIWVDVFSPTVHYDFTCNMPISVTATYENWRYKDRFTNGKENNQSSWKWAAPKNAIFKKDSIAFSGNMVSFFHHNTSNTIFDTTVSRQGLAAYRNEMYNPLANLISGGMMYGKGFKQSNLVAGTYANTDYKGWQLVSAKPAKNQSLSVKLYNSVVANPTEMLLQFLPSVKIDEQYREQETIKWWQQFWNRSFIHINKNRNDSAWNVGRNYQLFRYMLGINAKGFWPTKFNGGLLTTDPYFVDTSYKYTPDFRNWGGGVHTAQNQRLVHFPMLKNNDWDIIQSQFQFYLRILKNAELRSKVYWNHAGACFTEQMENFGLPNIAEYGTKRPLNFEPGLEHNAWLEYEWDTVLEFCLMMIEEYNYTGKNIDDKISFILSCLRFFDEHYTFLAKQRGIKALNENGKLMLYPGSGGETYKMAYNATSTVAALKTVSNKLLSYISDSLYSDTSVANYLYKFIAKIPEINFTNKYGKPTIAPALHYERINNIEPMQLYPVFPWRMYGVGKSGLDTARNTFLYDSLAIGFRSHIGWKQDNIFAANLGLANDAWKYTYLKLKDGDKRFPTFWGPGFDWLPDHNWGGSGMIGLQDMLLQNNGKQIILFPAWPIDKDVHFKLHAYNNTVIEAVLKNGKLITLNVTPKEREKDIVIDLK